MPKLFRPKLTQAASKTTCQTTNVKSPTEETKTCSSSEKSNVVPEITNSTTSVSPSAPKVTSPLPVSLPQNEKTPEPHEELSSNSVQRPPIVSPKSPTTVDIDQPMGIKRKRKAIISPESDHEKIELFKPKKPRTTTLKHSLEPPPDPDQPLDRTTVSLRSLLNWVPTNKPPPSYRQASFVKSENSDAAVGKSVKLEPPVFKSETAFQSPGKSSSTPPLDLLAPQLRLDADGNIVLDESSLLVSMPEVARDDSNVRHVNEETGLLNVTYNSFRNQRDRHGRRWSPQETVRFYRALTTFGRDFYLMATMFPNRSRAELKRKFSRESRSNPYLVNQALRSRREYDLTALVPISDEDEGEIDQDVDKDKEDEEEKKRRGKQEKKNKNRKVRKTQKTKTKSDSVVDGQPKRKVGRRSRKQDGPNRQSCPNQPTDFPTTTYTGDSIMDTIDAVLAHFCRSPSDTNAIPPAETQNSVTTTASSSRSSKDNISAHHAPAIEQMLDSAMRRVKHSQHAVGDADAGKSVESVSRTQESSDTEEPLVVVDLGPVPPASVDMIPVHAISENAKIDMLLTGRKLLSE